MALAHEAVERDDRFSGTDADRRENISHDGGSGFGGNADSAETADLRPRTHYTQIAAGRLRCVYGAVFIVSIKIMNVLSVK